MSRHDISTKDTALASLGVKASAGVTTAGAKASTADWATVDLKADSATKEKSLAEFIFALLEIQAQQSIPNWFKESSSSLRKNIAEQLQAAGITETRVQGLFSNLNPTSSDAKTITPTFKNLESLAEHALINFPESTNATYSNLLANKFLNLFIELNKTNITPELLFNLLKAFGLLRRVIFLSSKIFNQNYDENIFKDCLVFLKSLLPKLNVQQIFILIDSKSSKYPNSLCSQIIAHHPQSVEYYLEWLFYLKLETVDQNQIAQHFLYTYDLNDSFIDNLIAKKDGHLICLFILRGFANSPAIVNKLFTAQGIKETVKNYLIAIPQADDQRAIALLKEATTSTTNLGKFFNHKKESRWMPAVWTNPLEGQIVCDLEDELRLRQKRVDAKNAPCATASGTTLTMAAGKTNGSASTTMLQFLAKGKQPSAAAPSSTNDHVAESFDF